MLLVPEASVPPVLMCCDSSAAGISVCEREWEREEQGGVGMGGKERNEVAS